MADVNQDTHTAQASHLDEKIKNEQSDHEDDDDEDNEQLHVNEDAVGGDHNDADDESNDDDEPVQQQQQARAPSSVTKQLATKQHGAASSSTPVKKAPNSYSFREAAIEILKTQGPMSAKDLTQRMIDSKMIATTGKTPDRTVAALMYSEIKQKGNAAAFYLPARGVFGLTECSNDERHKAVAAAAAASGNTSTAASVVGGGEKKRPRKSNADNDKAKKPKKQRKDAGAADGKKKKTKKQFDENSDSEKTEESDEEAGTAAKRKRPDNGKSRAINTPVRNPNRKADDGHHHGHHNHHPGGPTSGGAYNDEYGYMYLRYFLDITRRQEEGDYSPEDDCFICKNGGDLICCDFPDCSKVYHLSCLGMSKIPGGKWYCSTHYCAVCNNNKDQQKQSQSKAAVYNCATCTNAYCEEHLPKDDVKHIRKGFIVCKSCMPYFLREIDD